MARRAGGSGADESAIPVDGRPVQQVDIRDEAVGAWLPYSATSNYRMIPNVYDGLKPVHRRALYTLLRSGVRSASRFVKTATAVGATMKYHPHGNAGIEDAFKTLTWSPTEGAPIRIPHPLVEGHGNWGSLDDNPAQARYTECRLSRAGERMLGFHEGSAVSEIDEGVVDMAPNYSGDVMEPTVLPALFPAFVVNNSKGIGTPVKSEVPSHNLREVMDLAIKLVDTPSPHISTIAKIMPGPDLPCDCDIYIGSKCPVPDYYQDGRGAFIMRARYELNRTDNSITFTGFPIGVSATHAAEGIQKLVERGDLDPQVSAVNMSSAEGMRLRVDCGKADLGDTLQRLLFHGRITRLQVQFNVGMNAFVDGYIRMVAPVEAIRLWLSHRRRSIRARSMFRKRKWEDRLEIVTGFLKAVPVAEELVKVVRESSSKSDAVIAMTERWGFTETQCAAILDMSISQITALGVERYEREQESLLESVKECTRILGDSSYLDKVLKREIRTVRDELGGPRRCRIIRDSGKVPKPTRAAVVAPSTSLKLAVTPSMKVRAGARAPRQMLAGLDCYTRVLDANDRSVVEAVTNMGRHIRIDAGEIPTKSAAKLSALSSAVGVGEEVVGFGLSDPEAAEGNPDLFIVTSHGNFKRYPYEGYSSGRRSQVYRVAPLEDGETVVSTFPVARGETRRVVFVTDRGFVSSVELSKLPIKKSRSAGTMPGIKLSDGGARVIWAGLAGEDESLVFLLNGSVDRVGLIDLADIGAANRNVRGKRLHLSDGEGVHQVLCALPAEASTIAWMGPSLDDPERILLDSAARKRISFSRKRSLGLEVLGISEATAVWPEVGREA